MTKIVTPENAVHVIGGGLAGSEAAFQIACQIDHCCRALAFADRCAEFTTCAMGSRASGWSLPYVLYWFLDSVYSGHQPFVYPYFLSHCVTVVPPVLGTCTNQRTPQRIADAGERTRPVHDDGPAIGPGWARLGRRARARALSWRASPRDEAATCAALY